jgi:catechol 2,3-dioxygenase-like lactoylglutathione lyase family enzyme
MLDHAGLNVSDLSASRAFYDRALEPLGIRPLREFPQACGYGDADKPYFWTFERGTASTGVHVAFESPDRATVASFYEAAIAGGGRDNGEPGPRPIYHQHYYGGFVLDPDGNNVEAVCHSPEG